MNRCPMLGQSREKAAWWSTPSPTLGRAESVGLFQYFGGHLPPTCPFKGPPPKGSSDMSSSPLLSEAAGETNGKCPLTRLPATHSCLLPNHHLASPGGAAAAHLTP